MPRLHASDIARANWSSVPALLGALVVVLISMLGHPGEPPSLAELWIDSYLVAWPAFVGTYLVWTHMALARQGPQDLAQTFREERRPRRRPWATWLLGGATSWTLSAALIAVLLAFVIAQSPAHRSNWLSISLGLVSVACSWALMVYSFAQQYLRLTTRGDDEGVRHVELGLDGGARFEDYLTLAVLLSTMAATVSAQIRSRQAWRLVRANVLFAFVFNTVIVAMVVSLLFGGLVD